MANKCAICGAEVNLLQGQKLADGNYICRKLCRAKGLKAMDYVAASLPDVEAHIAQVERGTKLWNHYFVPRKKGKGDMKLKRFGANLYVATDIGLIAFTETRYKFMVFGATVSACVYRIADLMEYEYEEEKKTVDGKQETKHYIHYYFKDTPGLADFRFEISGKLAYDEQSKYFDKLFGIQKTLRNAANNFKRDFEAMKGLKDGISAALNDAEDAEDKVALAAEKWDASKYGDRTEWIQKADKALSEF